MHPTYCPFDSRSMESMFCGYSTCAKSEQSASRTRVFPSVRVPHEHDRAQVAVSIVVPSVLPLQAAGGARIRPGRARPAGFARLLNCTWPGPAFSTMTSHRQKHAGPCMCIRNRKEASDGAPGGVRPSTLLPPDTMRFTKEEIEARWAAHIEKPVSYTHLTLPTNREV